MEMPAVEGGDPGGFLSPVLERVQPQRDEARSVVGTPDAEHAALFAQFVVFEWIGRQHVFGLSWRQ
jgi:hypothetical protein